MQSRRHAYNCKDDISFRGELLNERLVFMGTDNDVDTKLAQTLSLVVGAHQSGDFKRLDVGMVDQARQDAAADVALLVDQYP